MRTNDRIYSKVNATDAKIEELAKVVGYKLPSESIAVFKSVYAKIEEANKNGVRLARKAVIEALPTLIGTQVNLNHYRKGYIVGSIFWAGLNEHDEIEIAFTFFKSVYPKEYKEAMSLLENGELTVSFELSSDKDSQVTNSDRTRTINDFYFDGVGLLLNEKPAYPRAKVYETAKQLIDNTSLVFASQEVKEYINLVATLQNILKGNEQDKGGEQIMTQENVEITSLQKLFASILKEEEITFELAMQFHYASIEDQERISEEAKKWTRQYINNLPDSAFAVIEPAYSEKTSDKNARHLPHHDGEGDLGKTKSNANLDLLHLRNALARVNQINPISDSIATEELRSKAEEHLNRHKDALEKAEVKLCPECQEPMEQDECSKCKTKKASEEDIAPIVEISTEVVVPVEQATIVSQSIVTTETTKIHDTDSVAVQIVEQTQSVEINTESGETSEINEIIIRNSKWTRPQIEEKMASDEGTISQLTAKVTELEQTLKNKNEEILKAKEEAVKIERIKVELGEYVKEFKDEDFTNEDKLTIARLRKEKDELKAKAPVETASVSPVKKDLATGHVDVPVTNASNDSLVSAVRETIKLKIN